VNEFAPPSLTCRFADLDPVFRNIPKLSILKRILETGLKPANLQMALKGQRTIKINCHSVLWNTKKCHFLTSKDNVQQQNAPLVSAARTRQLGIAKHAASTAHGVRSRSDGERPTLSMSMENACRRRVEPTVRPVLGFGSLRSLAFDGV